MPMSSLERSILRNYCGAICRSYDDDCICCVIVAFEHFEIISVSILIQLTRRLELYEEGVEIYR